jgi:hypothetical protein
MKVQVEVEVIAGEAGVPVFHVAGYGGLPDLWVYRGDDGALRSIWPRRGCDGCRVARPPLGWPPLEAVVREALR